MIKKVIAWGLIASISIAFLTAFVDGNEEAYTVAGLGMIVFGIMAAVQLFKVQK